MVDVREKNRATLAIVRDGKSRPQRRRSRNNRAKCVHLTSPYAFLRDVLMLKLYGGRFQRAEGPRGLTIIKIPPPITLTHAQCGRVTVGATKRMNRDCIRSDLFASSLGQRGKPQCQTTFRTLS